MVSPRKDAGKLLAGGVQGLSGIVGSQYCVWHVSRRADRTAAIVILVAVVLAAASYLTASSGLFECRDELLAERPSGDGRIIASTVQRKCGVFAGDSTLVVMRVAGQPESVDEYASVVSATGQCAVRTEFVSDTLAVTVPGTCDAGQNAEEWNGVTIQLSRK
jgi:hypothetical protein